MLDLLGLLMGYSRNWWVSEDSDKAVGSEPGSSGTEGFCGTRRHKNGVLLSVKLVLPCAMKEILLHDCPKLNAADATSHLMQIMHL